MTFDVTKFDRTAWRPTLRVFGDHPVETPVVPGLDPVERGRSAAVPVITGPHPELWWEECVLLPHGMYALLTGRRHKTPEEALAGAEAFHEQCAGVVSAYRILASSISCRRV